MRYFVITGLLIWMSWTQSLPRHLTEICDNSIDDDGDLVVDLNDPDCACIVEASSSLIPNPSFEDMICCPDKPSLLYCADTWIQASAATTDYLHTCDWIGQNYLSTPLPFPDGSAAVAFRDGFVDASGWNVWKEYTGACVLELLEKDQKYRIEFFLGFTDSIHSPPLNITIFGAPECNDLPFGFQDPNFGCPTNSANWIEMGSALVSGQDEWVPATITFTAPQDLAAISLGPACEVIPYSDDRYYFLDRLILTEIDEFGGSGLLSSDQCADILVLAVDSGLGSNFQWYRDGIALPGENSPRLSIENAEGDYQVWVDPDSSCLLSQPYIHVLPQVNSSVSAEICEGDTYQFGNRSLAQPGVYRDTVKNGAGCDSLIKLDLTVLPRYRDTTSFQLARGESLMFNGISYSDPGEYLISTPSETGCDSILHLFVSFFDFFVPNVFSPNGDGINDTFNAVSGNTSMRVKKMSIFDRRGSLLFSRGDLSILDPTQGWNGMVNGKEMPPDVYVYVLEVLFPDGSTEVVVGSVTLLR